MRDISVELGQRWLAVAHGGLGGFGAASDFTWQAFGAIAYRFDSAGRYVLSAGYRLLDVDFGDDGFVFDIRMHGPLTGFSVSC